MTQPTTPMEVFETIRDRAITMLQTTFMESGRAWPEEKVIEGLLKPVLGIGIASASEYYASHPEHLALAGKPICTACRAPIQTLQVGVEGEAVKVAWPCGHYQS